VSLLWGNMALPILRVLQCATSLWAGRVSRWPGESPLQGREGKTSLIPLPKPPGQPSGWAEGSYLSAAGQELSKRRECDYSPVALTGSLLLKPEISCSISCSSGRGLLGPQDNHSCRARTPCSEAGRVIWTLTASHSLRHFNHDNSECGDDWEFDGRGQSRPPPPTGVRSPLGHLPAAAGQGPEQGRSSSM